MRYLTLHLRNAMLFFIVFFISLPSSFAQEIKYDDIIDEWNNFTPKQRYFRFFQYQKQDPHFANTYIQLADACEKVFMTLDPLREFNQVNYWVNNAILYYGLFPVYLKSNEVRRNRAYYIYFSIDAQGRRLDNEDVIAYANERINFCNNYKDNISSIFGALEKSKDHYNNCVRIFNDINNSYDNLNEALLQTDNEFLSILAQLENEFNATLQEFSNYKEMIRKFPIGNYNQTFQFLPIQTFRLDGLTNSDFLENSFNLWDYRSWVDEFRQIYQTDILSLRREVASIQTLFNENKRQLLIKETIDDDYRFETYDEFFMFRLGKYDNSSLIRELFRYLDTRQIFLVYGKSPLNLPSDSTSAIINRKLRYYHRLTEQHQQSVEMLNIFNTTIATERVIRFQEFFNQHYQGEIGLKNFYGQEQQFLNRTLNGSFQNLKSYFNNEEDYRKSWGMATGARRVSIPLYIEEDDEEIKGQTYITQNVSYSQGFPQFASGYINRQGKPAAFIANISAEHNEEGQVANVEWVREIGAKGRDVPASGDWAQILFGYGEGSMAIVSGEQDDGYRNTLVQLDNAGKIVLNKNLEIDLEPTFLQYDEINKQTLMAFGQKEADTLTHFSSISICLADSLGNIQWQTPLEINGKVVDIIKSENRFIAYINYNSYNIDGNQNTANNWAMLSLILSEDGEMLSLNPIPSTSSYHIDRVFAISVDEISLIGYAGEPNSKEEELVYLLVKPDGDIIFSNLK